MKIKHIFIRYGSDKFNDNVKGTIKSGVNLQFVGG